MKDKRLIRKTQSSVKLYFTSTVKLLLDSFDLKKI